MHNERPNGTETDYDAPIALLGTCLDGLETGSSTHHCLDGRVVGCWEASAVRSALLRRTAESDRRVKLDALGIR